MALHGLDRAQAPPADKAKAMLEKVHGSWWNVYIGGPRRNPAAASWTPDRVREYEAQGITRFLLIYVGRQQDDVPLLTTTQGRHDGDEACQIATHFGYGAGTPICLDLEARTFDASNRGSLDYACGWCQAVRAKGLRPGVYSNIRALVPLEARDERPDWVWVAKWVKHGVDPDADPHQIPDLPNDLWPEAGQRAWQYAGEFDKVALQVGGLDVDISVADSGCLVGEELTITDIDTRKFFDEKFKQTADHATELFRLSDHGSEDPGRSNHHKALREELQAFQTQVNQELSQLRSTLNRIATTLDRIPQ